MKVQWPVLQVFLLTAAMILGCNDHAYRGNEANLQCGIVEDECDLCQSFREDEPHFVVVVVGDGVGDETPARDRKYSINRAQGEAMWAGVKLATETSPFFKQVSDIIEIKGFDDGGSPECAEAIARCIYHNPCLLAVIGHATSGTTRAGAAYYSLSRVPVMMPIATSPTVFYPESSGTNRASNLFRLPPSDDRVQAYALGYVAKDIFNASRIYLLGDVSVDADAYSRPIFEKLDQEILGPAKTYSQIVSQNEAWGAASNIKQVNPDLVIFPGYWSNFQLILGPLRDLYPQESKRPSLLLSDGCLTNDINTSGFKCAITFPAPDVFDTSLEASDELLALRTLIKDRGHQSYEIYGYDALHILSQAALLAAKHGLSRTSLLNALSSGEEFQGAAFPYIFLDGENASSRYYYVDAKTRHFTTIPPGALVTFKQEEQLR